MLRELEKNKSESQEIIEEIPMRVKREDKWMYLEALVKN